MAVSWLGLLLLACGGGGDTGASCTPRAWYADADGDGYGTLDDVVEACAPPAGYVANAADCNDLNPSAHPEAEERCDGVDNDCDGLADEAGASDAPTWYLDQDGDGHGGSTHAVTACAPPPGYVATRDDCDDGDPAVHPGAIERCDLVDEDCDGEVDEDVADPGTWYPDADGDGYGDPAGALEGCPPDAGWVENGWDCDDEHAEAHPGATEVCDGLDDDCDGVVDGPEAEGAASWWLDHDGDGHGDPAIAVTACEPPAGYVADPTDCDDLRSDVHPGADERCDGVDNDCMGDVDEDDAVDAPTWYADADGDGYGDPAATAVSCGAPAGHVAAGDDCDDGDPAVHPGADEVCGGGDEDCDGLVDEADAVDAPVWYLDADGDGFGTAASTTWACTRPAGFAGEATDCDDGDPTVNPDAAEVCYDGLDNDCDGTARGCAPVGLLAPGDAAAAFVAPSGGQALGTALAGGADLDGDGAPDLAFGASLAGAGGTQAGAVHLLAGPALGGGDVDALGAVAVEGATAGGQLGGWAMAAIPDTDGDGLPELLVGSPLEALGAAVPGAAWLLRGLPTAAGSVASLAAVRFDGEVDGDYAGFALGGGDVDGDGLADVAVGSPLHGSAASPALGRVALVRAPLGSVEPLAGADLVLDGVLAYDFSGIGLDLGDVDADGLPEVLVGAPLAEGRSGTYPGVVYVVEGSITGSVDLPTAATAILAGDASYEEAGAGVAYAGDLDGDGYGDLLASAWDVLGLGSSAASPDGRVYVAYGPFAGLEDLAALGAVVTSGSPEALLGRSLAAPGDVDGDGYGEVLLGAPYDDAHTVDGGRAFLGHGPLSGTMEARDLQAVFNPENLGELLGWAVAGAGDQDGDGTADLLVGLPGDNAHGTLTGAALLFLGGRI